MWVCGCVFLYVETLALSVVTALHTGNPGVEKSKKIISLNIAILVREKTDLVRARLSMEGSIIEN